jgi:hypothetical protein
MIWIIVLSALALYVIFIICLLIIGSWADDRKEAIFTNRFGDSSDNDVASSSSLPVMPESLPGAIVQHREIPSAAMVGR